MTERARFNLFPKVRACKYFLLFTLPLEKKSTRNNIFENVKRALLKKFKGPFQKIMPLLKRIKGPFEKIKIGHIEKIRNGPWYGPAKFRF